MALHDVATASTSASASSSPAVYDVQSFIAQGSFGSVFAARLAPAPPAKRARALLVDDAVVVKQALLVREKRLRDLRGPHAAGGDAASGRAWVCGEVFEPRELTMTRMIGHRFDARAALAAAEAALRRRVAAIEADLARGSDEDEAAATVASSSSTTAPPEAEVPLTPTLFDAFIARDAAEGSRGGATLNLVLVSQRFGSDLWMWINSRPDVFASEAFRRCIVRQALSSLARLHARGLVHRDLKLPNLLLDLSPSGFPLLRIGDMGSCRAVPGPGEAATPYVTSRFYRPPELLCGASSYGPAVDVWALACTLVELYAQLAALTDARAAASLSQLRGDGSDAAVTPATASRRRCTLFHGARNDGAQIAAIFNILGCPTDEDVHGMRVPAWAAEWLRSQRWWVETCAALEARDCELGLGTGAATGSGAGSGGSSGGSRGRGGGESLALLPIFLRETQRLQAAEDLRNEAEPPRAPRGAGNGDGGAGSGAGAGARAGAGSSGVGAGAGAGGLGPAMGPHSLSAALASAVARVPRARVGSLDLAALLTSLCGVPGDLAALFARMLAWDPRRRFSCAEALRHPALVFDAPATPGLGQQQTQAQQQLLQALAQQAQAQQAQACALGPGEGPGFGQGQGRGPPPLPLPLLGQMQAQEPLPAPPAPAALPVPLARLSSVSGISLAPDSEPADCRGVVAEGASVGADMSAGDPSGTEAESPGELDRAMALAGSAGSGCGRS